MFDRKRKRSFEMIKLELTEVCIDSFERNMKHVTKQKRRFSAEAPIDCTVSMSYELLITIENAKWTHFLFGSAW